MKIDTLFRHPLLRLRWLVALAVIGVLALDEVYVHFVTGNEDLLSILIHEVPIILLVGAAIWCRLSQESGMSSRKNPTQESASFSSGEGFHLLFEHHPVPMWIYNLKTLSFLAVNDAALAKYGYSQEEFLRMTIKDIRRAGVRGYLSRRTHLCHRRHL